MAKPGAQMKKDERSGQALRLYGMPLAYGAALERDGEGSAGIGTDGGSL